VYIDLDFQIPICSHFKIHLPWYFFFIFHFSLFLYYTISFLIRDQPFNLKGGVYGFLFRSENIFPTTQELGYFFLSGEARIFFPEFNIDKNSESDYFFFLHQNQNIFFSNIGNQNIFLEKNHNPPPLLPWNRRTWSRHLQ
jgi:hypothetical protein